MPFINTYISHVAVGPRSEPNWPWGPFYSWNRYEGLVLLDRKSAANHSRCMCARLEAKGREPKKLHTAATCPRPDFGGTKYTCQHTKEAKGMVNEEWCIRNLFAMSGCKLIIFLWCNNLTLITILTSTWLSISWPRLAPIFFLLLALVSNPSAYFLVECSK